MRTFIAIDFSRELKDRITGLQSDLRPFASRGRWKYIDNFHLTLKFLGETKPGTVKSVEEALTAVSAGISSFNLRIGDMGSFGNNSFTRVLWLGLAGDVHRLLQLKEGIDQALLKIGFDIERRGFTPHVTIGQDLEFVKDLDALKQLFDSSGFPEISVDRFYLFNSEQIGKRRIYTPIHEFRLR